MIATVSRPPLTESASVAARSFHLARALGRGLGFCLLLLAGSFLAAQAPAPDHRPGPPAAIALSHCVEQLKPAFRSGNPAAIKAAVQNVELLRRTFGTMDVLPLVEAMAIFARDLGNQGDPAQGLKVLDIVERWAPRHPTLLGTRVILLRQEGPQGYLWSIADTLELTRLRLADPFERWLWAVQHIAWLRMMATLLLWGWALTMALRYRMVFRYTMEEPLQSRALDARIVAFGGAFLVALPVVFGFDPSFVAMVWLWVLAPFLLPMEIKATLVIILVQLVHPALSLLEPMAGATPSPSILTLQQRPQLTPWNEKILARLTPGDRTFLEGWSQLENQEWDKAEHTFEALTKNHPDQAIVLNNLGVARFQQGNLPGAKACFDEAANIAPDKGEILLNQSVIAFRQMDAPLGFAKQEDANRLAPEAFNRILAVNQSRDEQRTFALPLPDSPERSGAVASALAPGASRPGPDSQIFFLLLNLGLPLLAAGAFHLRLRSSTGESHPAQCVRCGDPFHITDSPEALVCSKCHHLFVLKDGLHAESRKKKVEEVGQYQFCQRWLHHAMVLALPGTDLLLLGETRAVLLEFATFCLALGLVLATGRSMTYPGEILPDPASVWMPLGIALLLVLFLRSWLKLLPRRG